MLNFVCRGSAAFPVFVYCYRQPLHVSATARQKMKPFLGASILQGIPHSLCMLCLDSCRQAMEDSTPFLSLYTLVLYPASLTL